MLAELCQDIQMEVSNLGISNRREVGIGSSSNVLGADLFKNSRTVVSETVVKDKSGLPLKGLPI